MLGAVTKTYTVDDAPGFIFVLNPLPEGQADARLHGVTLTAELELTPVTFVTTSPALYTGMLMVFVLPGSMLIVELSGPHVTQLAQFSTFMVLDTFPDGMVGRLFAK